MLEGTRAHRELRRLAAWTLRKLGPLQGTPLWTAAVTARSAAGRGPLVAAPVARRALVLAPHPDDEAIGCGGTTARLTQRGAEVHVVVASSGGASVIDGGRSDDVEQRRRQEAIDACQHLGAASPTFLDLPDGELTGHLDELIAGVRRALDDLRPEVVFAPWPGDDHPDHQAVAQAVVAARPGTGTEVWWYEVWAALPANRLVDVTDVWPKKVAAVSCHETAGDLSAHLGLARWRSLFGLDGQGWAEAFMVVSGDQLAAAAGAS